ncbi:MAG: L,D-transpeptidase [Alphaproteobacteria bacterium]|nr:L,D-transpeptidase [Alphaproteobacteria bacterium]
MNRKLNRKLNFLAAISCTLIAGLAATSAARAQDSHAAFFAQEKSFRTAALHEASRPSRMQQAATKVIVADPTGKAAGAVTIDTKNRFLYLSLGEGRAIRYTIGVGRAGFEWSGNARVGRKAEWPAWTPPPAMLKRRPDLPRHMAGGIDNPLGARAMYLYNGNRDTMYRIHGTNEPDTIGQAVSSGCIRMLNADVIDLHSRIRIGAPVQVI